GVEEFLGRFVNELTRSSLLSADQIQIHTKYVPDIDLLGKLTSTYTESIIDRSLKRLNRDVLDLVQFHWWDYGVPGAVDTASHLQALKEKGKIRHLAVTNFDSEHLAQIVDAGIEVVSCPTQYSVVDRRPEKQLLKYCSDKNIAQICYGTLAGGLLSEKWLGQKFPNEADNRSQVKYMQVIEEGMGVDLYQQLLGLLGDIAAKHEVSIANVATRYILDQEGVAATIIGTRSTRHIASNENIFAFRLDAADTEAIRNFLAQAPILPGEPFELERTEGSVFRGIMKMNLNEADK
ncbi:MAG TPA: aldo/keto reductase, partial [Bacillota bacterium]|nr:aldo/keto reductase [Bacillota bacterium]